MWAVLTLAACEGSPFSADGQPSVWICRTNMPEAEGTNSNYEEQIAESRGFDAVSTKISNTAAAVFDT
jgi:hypothetical protein